MPQKDVETGRLEQELYEPEGPNFLRRLTYAIPFSPTCGPQSQMKRGLAYMAAGAGLSLYLATQTDASYLEIFGPVLVGAVDEFVGTIRHYGEKENMKPSRHKNEEDILTEIERGASEALKIYNSHKTTIGKKLPDKKIRINPKLQQLYRGEYRNWYDLNNDLVRLGYSDDIRCARRLGVDVERLFSSILINNRGKREQRKTAKREINKKLPYELSHSDDIKSYIRKRPKERKAAGSIITGNVEDKQSYAGFDRWNLNIERSYVKSGSSEIKRFCDTCSQDSHPKYPETSEPTIKRFCDTCGPSVPEAPPAKPEVKPRPPSFWGTAMDLYLAQDYMKRVAGDKGMGITGFFEGGFVAKKVKKHMGDENPGLLESAAEVYVAQDYARRVKGEKDMGVTGFVEGGLVGREVKKRMR